jgi:hypothetical protein
MQKEQGQGLSLHSSSVQVDRALGVQIPFASQLKRKRPSAGSVCLVVIQHILSFHFHGGLIDEGI